MPVYFTNAVYYSFVSKGSNRDKRNKINPSRRNKSRMKKKDKDGGALFCLVYGIFFWLAGRDSSRSGEMQAFGRAEN
ncbi:hypothetical protein CI102_14211 [Trichoderma harzianum]|nr:hypothetical protein CI102_14211 [Trichoderma harzianum]